MRISILLAVGLLGAADAPAQGTKAAPPQVVPIAHTSARTPMRSHASLKVTVVGDAETQLQGWTQAGGLRAYGLVVPPGGRVTVRLRHAKAGYFKVTRKVLHNLGYLPDKCLSGDPQDCFNNATGEAMDVYFVVSDPEHWADEKSPFTLEITRSWKPGAGPTGVKVREELSL